MFIRATLFGLALTAACIAAEPAGESNFLANARQLTLEGKRSGEGYFSPDGNWVSFSSERSGINDEEPLVQEVVFAPQMYGEIFIQRISDGKTIRVTHNKWEEGTSFWLPPAN